MDSKKRREWFLLERFIEASELAAEIVEQREAPDFVIRFEGRLVGVEVTELFVSHDANGPLPQAQERISSGIVSHARELYVESGAPPAHVSLCFAPLCDLRRVDRHDFAAKLCSFVRGLNLAEWQRIVWRPGDDGSALPSTITYLQALGVPADELGHWAVARAGWVAPLTSDALQSRIDDKTLRLRTYQHVIAENWLVVIADGTKPSQLFEVRPAFAPAALTSPFSRTFFYGYPDRAIIELGLRATFKS